MTVPPRLRSDASVTSVPPAAHPPHHTLWLGAAGTGTAFGILRSIHEQFPGTIRVIAADMFPRHLVASAMLADCFEQVPPVSEPSFPGALRGGLSRHGVDTYVPILDEEIWLAATLRDSGELTGIDVAAPPTAAAEICLDKQLAARWLADNGLPTPATAEIGDFPWRPEGVMVKPARGRGSVGVRLVESERELDALRATEPSLIAQQRCRAPEVTIDAVRANGTFRAVCRERIEVKAGVCTKARVFDDQELAALAHAVANGLDLRGAFCMQVMRAWDDDARWQITDINPRPGAGTRLTVAAGVEILAAGLAALWGLDVAPFLPPLPRPTFVLRQYAEYVVAE